MPILFCSIECFIFKSMRDMEHLRFDEAIPESELKEADRIAFGFHINAFDYPHPHEHLDYWEFTVMTDGEVENRINGKSVLCPKNTLFYATTEDIHSLHKRGTQKPRYINISVRASRLYPLLESIAPGLKDRFIKGDHFHKVSDQFVLDIESIVHCANALSSTRLETNDIAEAAALLAIQRIYLDMIQMPENKSSFSRAVNELSLEPSFLLYSVADLCERLNYSRVQLNRLFKKDFGCTPHEYLVKTKLRYASSLLINSSISISEIASKVGFSNLSQFNANFKREFGTTPGSYRKNPHR